MLALSPLHPPSTPFVCQFTPSASLFATHEPSLYLPPGPLSPSYTFPPLPLPPRMAPGSSTNTPVFTSESPGCITQDGPTAIGVPKLPYIELPHGVVISFSFLFYKCPSFPPLSYIVSSPDQDAPTWCVFRNPGSDGSA